MDTFVQLLLAGICIGAVYGFGALGFVLIYKASGVFNMAHGDMMMVGAFVFLALSSQLNLNIYLALALTIVVSAAVGYLIHHVLVRPMIGQPTFAIIMITVALMFVLRGVILLIWGSETYAYSQMLPVASLRIGGAFVAAQYIGGLVLALVALGLFILYFRYTKTGLAMRAAADDEQLAQSMGVVVRHVTGLAWALAGAATALAGITIGMMTSVNFLLNEVGLTVLPVVVLGGLESTAGAIVAGLIVGVVGNIAGGYLESFLPAVKDVAPYIIMLLILLIKPHGLFGQKRIERI